MSGEHSFSSSSLHNGSSTIHWGWYATSLLVAIVMAVSSAVISFNFMVAHTPLLVSVTCAACGFLLNLLLYWRDKAKQLHGFATELVNKPKETLHHCLTSILPSVAIGFLTFISYFDQLNALPLATQRHIPILALSAVLAVANVVGSVVLFYQPSAKEGATPPISPVKNWTWQSRLYAIFAPLKRVPGQLQAMGFKDHCAALISLTQSALYSATNYYCIQRSLALLAPLMRNPYTQAVALLLQRYCLVSPVLLSSAFSLVMTACLFSTELLFNYNKLKSASLPSVIPYYQSVITCIVLLNGFANGWITLGDFTHLSLITQALVVLVGTTVSYAVMQNEVQSLDTTSDNQTLWAQFLPLAHNDINNALQAVLLTPIIALYSYFLFQPAALMAMYAYSPVLIIGSSFYLTATMIKPTIEGCRQAALSVKHVSASLSSFHFSSLIKPNVQSAESSEKSTDEPAPTWQWSSFFSGSIQFNMPPLNMPALFG